MVIVTLGTVTKDVGGRQPGGWNRYIERCCGQIVTLGTVTKDLGG